MQQTVAASLGRQDAAAGGHGSAVDAVRRVSRETVMGLGQEQPSALLKVTYSP
jgi:hypothetical protein